ncbi:MAG: fused MFS/spermidine synthase [bacterium]
MKRKKARVVPRQKASRPLNRLILASFLLSGLAGLMHEVVWAKLLVPLIGATAHAQAIVLCVFMGGLALGSVLYGRRSDRHGHPLRTYVALELLIGAYTLLLPLLLRVAGVVYVRMGTYLFEFAALKSLVRFILAISLVFVPAVLMGGTLPILARQLIERVEETQRQVAGLYALNSLGAVLGAGLAGFVTLPLLGVYPSLAIASALNFIAGALVFPLIKDGGPAAAGARSRVAGQGADRVKGAGAIPTPPVTYRPEQYVVTLLALALSGFAAMGYEVLFIRIIALSFGSSTYSFTVMLMSFITGITMGSMLVSRLTVKRPLWLLAVSQLAVAVTLLAATPLVSRLPYLIGLLRIALQDHRLGFELYQLGKALLCLVVLLLPTTCLGFCFPLVAQVQARHPRQIGTHVGSTYAWNTVGNVLGVVVTSLMLLPWLGLLGGFHVNLALNFIAGFALLLVAREVRGGLRVATAAAASVAVVLYLTMGAGWSDSINFASNHLRLRSGPDASLDMQAQALHPASSFSAWKRSYVVRKADVKFFYFGEDSHTTVLVAGDEENIQLCVNSKPDASTVRDLDSQMLMAHAPLFLAPNGRTLLVVGHGSGITAGSALRHPIERADIVEISRAVLDADFLFAAANYQVLKDPRVRVFVDDGQSFLRTVPYNYDVIISQPSNPWVEGIGGLFTVEFFELVRSKLNPDGIFTFWFHSYEQSDTAVQMVFRTLGSVFPYVMVFGDNDLGNMIAVASMDRIEPDFAKMDRRFAEPKIRNDLARLGISNLAGFLSHHRISQERFPALLSPGPMNTVGHQRLEYMAARSFFLREDSFFIERFDPFVQGVTEETDVLLDRYIVYRAAAGDPVSQAEFDDAARYASAIGGYGPQVARWITMRAR